MNWHLQTRPGSTITTRHVRKITNKNTMSKLMNRFNPNAIALSIDFVGENSSIINAHVNLITDDLGQTKLLSISERDIVDVSIGWVGGLDVS